MTAHTDLIKLIAQGQYRCTHFGIKELVSPITFALRGEAAWELLDIRALITLDQLRRKFGPLTVNDWAWGGGYQWSGLRTPESPDYSPTSQHTFGRAFDCKFKNTTAAEVREYVRTHPEEFPFLTSFEEGTDGWFHFDVRNCTPVMTYWPGK